MADQPALFQPTLISNADPELPTWPHIWPLLQWATLFQLPHIFTLLRLPTSVRARVVRDTGAFTYLRLLQVLYKSPLAPSRVTIHSESQVNLLPRAVEQLPTCHCYEKYLNLCPIPFPHPPTMVCGEYFWVPPHTLHPVTTSLVIKKLFFCHQDCRIRRMFSIPLSFKNTRTYTQALIHS